MPFLRKLLSPYENEDILEKTLSMNCINGYFLENTTICICYPGWTSSSYNLEQCSVDTGENNTNSFTNKNKGIVDSNEETNGKNISAVGIVLIIILILLALGIFVAIFLCLFKKYKDIKLIKEKIKFEKKRNKKEDGNTHGEKGKDINSENNTDDEKNSIDLKVICENKSNSINDTEINE